MHQKVYIKLGEWKGVDGPYHLLIDPLFTTYPILSST